MTVGLSFSDRLSPGFEMASAAGVDAVEIHLALWRKAPLYCSECDACRSLHHSLPSGVFSRTLTCFAQSCDVIESATRVQLLFVKSYSKLMVTPETRHQCVGRSQLVRRLTSCTGHLQLRLDHARFPARYTNRTKSCQFRLHDILFVHESYGRS